MTDQELEAIEARAAAATAGPWETRDNNDEGPGVSTVPTPKQGGRGDDLLSQGTDGLAADLVFVAHARADVPELVAEARRLRALLVAAQRESQRIAKFTGSGWVHTVSADMVDWIGAALVKSSGGTIGEEVADAPAGESPGPQG